MARFLAGLSLCFRISSLTLVLAVIANAQCSQQNASCVTSFSISPGSCCTSSTG
jgi:hypothetical protein